MSQIASQPQLQPQPQPQLSNIPADLVPLQSNVPADLQPVHNSGIPWFDRAQDYLLENPGDKEHTLAVLQQFRSAGEQGPNYHTQIAGESAPEAAQSNLLGYSAQHPALGRIFSGANALTGGMEGAIANTVGLVAPQTAEPFQQAIPTQAPTNPNLPETGTLNAIGGVAPTLLVGAANPIAGAAMMGAQGAGGVRNDIANLRQQGENISGGREATLAGLQGGTQAGIGALLGPLGQKVEGLFEGVAPSLQNAVEKGTATAVQRLFNTGLKAAGKSASGAVVNNAANVASNLIKRGYDPDTALSEGWKQATILGSVFPHLAGTTPEATEAAAPSGSALEQRLQSERDYAAQGKPLNPAEPMPTAPPVPHTPEENARLEERIRGTPYSSEDMAKLAQRLQSERDYTAQGKPLNPAETKQSVSVTPYTPEENARLEERLRGTPYSPEDMAKLEQRLQPNLPQSKIEATPTTPLAENQPPLTNAEQRALNTAKLENDVQYQRVREAGRQFENTAKQNMGVSQLSPLLERARAANANAATPESVHQGILSQSEHPESFNDAKSLANWAAKQDPDVKAGESPKATSEYFHGELKNLDHGNEPFVKTNVPISALKLNESYQPEKENEYAMQSGTHAPPVIGGSKDGQIVLVDGDTRARAALARGETTIPAYLPKTDVESLGGKVIQGAKNLVQNEEGGFRNPFSKPTAPVTNESPIDIAARKLRESGQAKPLDTLTGRAKLLQSLRIPDWHKATQELKGVHGKIALAQNRLDTMLQPYRDISKSLPLDRQIAFVDSMDKTGTSTEPELKGLEGPLRQLAKENREKAKAKGINTKNWRDNYVGFLADKPKGMNENDYQNRIQRFSEGYLKHRESPDYGTYLKAVQEAGLQPLDPVTMIERKQTQVAASLANRDAIDNMKAKGTAVVAEPGQQPAGWRLLPHQLANDRIATGGKGNKLYVPPGAEAAFRNAAENATSGSHPIRSLVRGMQFATDTFNTTFSMIGAVSHTVGQILKGDFNPSALKEGYRAVFKTADVLDENGDKDSARRLRNIAAAGADITKPKFTKNPLKWVGTAGQFVTQPLKAAAMLDHAQYADTRNWTPEQRQSYLRSANRTIDQLMGHGNAPGTLPPVIHQAAQALVPTLHLTTSGARMVGEALTNLASGKIYRQNPAMSAIAGQVITIAALSTAAQMAATKYNTGKAIPPQDANDILHPRTGLKTSDGNDARIDWNSSQTRFADLLQNINKRGLFDTVKSKFAPEIEAANETWTGLDWKRNIMSGLQRATALPKSILPYGSPEEWSTKGFGETLKRAGETLGGFRPAGASETKSKGWNQLEQYLGEHHTPLDVDQQNALAARKAANPNKYKVNGLADLLKFPDMTVKAIMEHGFDSLTPDEQKIAGPIVRQKLGKEFNNTTFQQRSKWLKQLKDSGV